MKEQPLERYSRWARMAWTGVASDPVEAWAYLRDYLARMQEGATDGAIYAAQTDWERRLHLSLNISPGDDPAPEFWDVWSAIVKELKDKGIDAGPETYREWNDGDAALVRAIWCLVRVLRPRNVVETGVAHGVTSRVILEALQRNGEGRLWSIDRPTLEAKWEEQVGVAVAESFRDRWTLIRGSSRRRLPRLLDQLGEIDLFVHDSLHTERNVRFEVEQAWKALRYGGVIVVDDIDSNPAFLKLRGNLPGCRSLVGEAEPLRPDPRRFNGKGLFGIFLKDAVAATGSGSRLI